MKWVVVVVVVTKRRFTSQGKPLHKYSVFQTSRTEKVMVRVLVMVIAMVVVVDEKTQRK